MPIQDLIEVACGTVTGRDHTFGGNLVLGKSNQDAVATAFTQDEFVAVLCDGCSSCDHSEVGAHLISKMMLNEILQLLNPLWGARPPQSPGVWSFGDCATWREGATSRLSFPGNAPPYIGYMMLPESKVSICLDDLEFRPVVSCGKNCDLLTLAADNVVAHLGRLSFLLESRGTDRKRTVETYFLCTATVAIIDKTCIDMLPIVVGTDGLEEVPDPSVFLEDRMFSNPTGITRALRKMNQPSVRIGGDPPRLVKTDGTLSDDTTIVAIRKKPCA